MNVDIKPDTSLRHQTPPRSKNNNKRHGVAWLKTDHEDDMTCTGSYSVVHLLLQGFSHLLDAGSFDELGQLERWFLDTPFTLQVLPLKTPVAWHGYSVSRGLQVHQQFGLLRGHVMHLHYVRTRHQLVIKTSHRPVIAGQMI